MASNVRVLEIPQDVLDSSRLSISELQIEMAVYLYIQRRLSIGKARELAGMSLWEFRQLLASRRISPHYDVDDLDEDISIMGLLAGKPSQESHSSFKKWLDNRNKKADF